MDCIAYKKRHHQNNDNSSTNDNNDEWEEFEELFLDPIESNDVQVFSSDVDMIANEESDSCTALRIEFGKSSDFYGRIVIYSLTKSIVQSVCMQNNTVERLRPHECETTSLVSI